MEGEEKKDLSLLNVEVSRIDLSTRTANIFRNEKIKVIGDLVLLRAADIFRWPHAGRKTVEEVRSLLGRLGLKLAEDNFVGVRDDKLLEELNAPPIVLTETDETNSGLNTLWLSFAPEALQRALLTRVDSLNLSVRAKNVLVVHGAKFLGDVALLRHQDLMKLKNSGRVTALEIKELLESFNLRLGCNIPDWSQENVRTLEAQLRAGITADLQERQSKKLTAVGSEPDCLETELARLANFLEPERNAQILVALWGWAGASPRTLESVGNEFGITRERVRQIEARALRKLEKTSVEVRFLQAAAKVIEQFAPDSDRAIAQALVREGVSKAPFSPWSVGATCPRFSLRWPFAPLRIGDEQFVVRKSEIEAYRRVLPVLRRKTSERGCVSIFSLSAELQLGSDAPGLISKVLALAPSVVWLDEPHEWLYSAEGTRNRLYNLCEKVLSVCHEIHLSELRRAVSKSRRLAMCPPRRILAAFVEKQGLGRVVDDVVHAMPDKCQPPAAESAEGRMLAVLTANENILDGEKFAEKCIEAGMNPTTFYIYRTISPVICSLGRGVFCKVGTQVPPGLVNEIVSVRRATPLATDYGWTPKGKLWFGTELTRQVMTAGSIRLNVFVSDLVQGEWDVLLPDGTLAEKATCKEVFVWSFRKSFTLLGAEPADHATLEFDLRARHIVVRVGGPGLFDEMQEAEPAEPAEEELA